MATQLACALATLGLEHENLLVLALNGDFGGNGSAGNVRCADHCFFSADHQNFSKLNAVADLAHEFFNLEEFALGHFVLFPTGLDNCVHMISPCASFLKELWTIVKP